MNSVTHFEIPCDDLERAIAFYRRAFGWHDSRVPDMDYVMAITTEVDEETQRPKAVGAINGGFYTRNDHASRVPVIVIDVPDMDAAIAAINAAGGTAAGPVHPVGDMGLYLQFTDTEDNLVGVWQSLHAGATS